MKQNRTTPLSLSFEVKDVLVKLRKLSERNWNWDVVLIDMINEIVKANNLDLGLSEEQERRLQALQQRPPRTRRKTDPKWKR